jgi:hypothetical protein
VGKEAATVARWSEHGGAPGGGVLVGSAMATCSLSPDDGDERAGQHTARSAPGRKLKRRVKRGSWLVHATQYIYFHCEGSNLQTAKEYYASTIQLTGGKNSRALFGVCIVRPY